MRLNYPDYIRLVKQAYREKRANNGLSPLLSKSTPANIRKECLNVFRERYHNQDEQILKAFFGTGKPLLQLIRDFETDKFRPLDNYLKEHTENTDNTNLELFAWLIDFQHRPYAYDKNFQLTDDEVYFLENNRKKETESITENTGLKEHQEMAEPCLPKEAGDASIQMQEKSALSSIAVLKDSHTKKRSKRAIIIFLSFIVIAGGMYAVWQLNQHANNVCVYWKNDHYEQVDCNEDPHGRIIITMNIEKVRRFRRITREDTITERSIGKIYYIKESNLVKLYTESGSYPEDLKRPLRVLSRYMYDNYLNKRDSSGRDSLQLKK